LGASETGAPSRGKGGLLGGGEYAHGARRRAVVVLYHLYDHIPFIVFHLSKVREEIRQEVSSDVNNELQRLTEEHEQACHEALLQAEVAQKVTDDAGDAGGLNLRLTENQA